MAKSSNRNIALKANCVCKRYEVMLIQKITHVLTLINNSRLRSNNYYVHSRLYQTVSTHNSIDEFTGLENGVMTMHRTTLVTTSKGGRRDVENDGMRYKDRERKRNRRGKGMTEGGGDSLILQS